MTVAAQLDVVLGGDNSGAIGAIEGTSRSLAGAGVAITAWGAVGVAALKSWTSGAIGLEQTWANTAAVTGQTIDQVTTAYTGMTADLAVAYGKSQQDIATGIYDIAQAGNYTVDQTNQIITAATQGAAAGLTTVAVATDGLTTILNGYRTGVAGTALSVADLDRINDVMFKTVAAGKISYEELNQQWGDTVPLASTLGIGIEELGAAYAMTTSQGISASETSTQLTAIMSGLLKPSTALTTALQEHGYASGQDLLAQKGLAGALQFVAEATGGQSDALAELFPNIRATKGLTALLNGDFAQFLALMTGATEYIDPVTGEIVKLGATEEALSKITATTGFQIDRLKASLGVLANQIGTTLLPFVKLAANVLTGLVSVFIDLPAPIKQFVGALLGISSAGFLVAGAIITAKALFAGLGSAIAAVIVPILAVAAALALLSVAWTRNWGGIRTASNRAVTYLQGQFRSLGVYLRTFGQVFDIVAKGVNPVAAAFFTLSSVADTLASKFPFLERPMSAISDAFLLMSDVAGQAGDAYEAFRVHLNPVAAVLESLGGTLQNMSDRFGPFASTVNLGAQALIALGLAAGDVGDALQAVLSRDWNEAIDEAKDAFADLQNAAVFAFQAIAQFSYIALDWVLDTGIPKVWGWVVDAAPDVWSGIKTLAEWTWDNIADLGDWTLNVAVPGIEGGIKSIAGKAGNWLKGYLLSGMSAVGDGTGGPDPFGTSGSLSATIEAWTLNVGVPGIVGAITGIAGRLGDWLRGYLYGGGLSNIPVIGGIASAAAGGIEVELGTIVLKVLDAITNLTVADVNGWLQEYIDAAGDFHATINSWTLSVDGDPKVDGDPSGKADFALAKLILANIYTFSGLRWAIETSLDPDIIFDPVRMIYAQLSKLVSGANITLNDLRWFAQMGNPVVAFKVGMDFAQTVKDKLPDISVPDVAWALNLANPATAFPTAMDLVGDITDMLPDLSLSDIAWSIALSVPDITMPGWDAVKDALRSAAEEAGIPDWFINKVLGDGNEGSDAPNYNGGSGGGSAHKLSNDLAGGIFEQIKSLGSQIAESIGSLASAVQAGARNVMSALAPMGTAFQTTGQTSSTAMKQLQTDVTSSMTQSQQTVTQTTTASTQAITQMSTQSSQAVTTNFTALHQSVSTNMQQSAQAVSTNASQMTSRLDQFAADASNAGDKAGNTFKTGISDGMDSAYGSALSGVADIKDAMSFNAYGEGFSGGSSFGEGAYNGALGWVGNMESVGRALGNAVVAGFNSVSKPGSPSKTATKQGKVYGEGLYVGAAAWLEPLKSMGRQLGGSLASESQAVFSASSNSRTARNLAQSGGTTQNFFGLTGDDLLALLRKAERGAQLADNVGRTSRTVLAGTGVRLGA